MQALQMVKQINSTRMIGLYTRADSIIQLQMNEE